MSMENAIKEYKENLKMCEEKIDIFSKRLGDFIKSTSMDTKPLKEAMANLENALKDGMNKISESIDVAGYQTKEYKKLKFLWDEFQSQLNRLCNMKNTISESLDNLTKDIETDKEKENS